MVLKNKIYKILIKIKKEGIKNSKTYGKRKESMIKNSELKPVQKGV
jgi:hypothetical protein